MAKRSNNPERLIYCSGPSWEGDGSKASSTCQFGQSLTTTSNRFKCHYCAVNMKPSDIHAGKNGFIKQRKDSDMNNEQQNEDRVIDQEITSEPPSTEEKPTNVEEPVKKPVKEPTAAKKAKKAINRKRRRW